MTYIVRQLFVLRSVKNTRRQCENRVEISNFKPGGALRTVIARLYAESIILMQMKLQSVSSQNPLLNSAVSPAYSDICQGFTVDVIMHPWVCEATPKMYECLKVNRQKSENETE